MASHPPGLGGWTCFDLAYSQRVLLWCCILVMTLAYLLLGLARERRAKLKKQQKSGPARPRARQAGGVVAIFRHLRGAAPKAADGASLEAGLLAGGACEETRIGAEQMAKACADCGVVRGLEAACLAVLIAVQRRLNYASVPVGILRHAGKPQEVDVEFELPAMSFAELVLAVDRRLLELSKSPAPASAEAAEVTFAWEQPAPADAPGLWAARLAGPGSVVVRGTSPVAEQSFKLLFEACAARPDGNLWEMPLIPDSAAQCVLAWGQPAKDFAGYRSPGDGRLVPVPQLLAGHPANPGADAVAGAGFRLSYEELFRRVRLVQQAVLAAAAPARRGKVVLFMPRGEAIAPALLGVLEAGFCAVPVDVHWPGDRAVSVAEDSEAVLALVDASSAQVWGGLGVKLPVVVVGDALLRNGGDGPNGNGAREPLDQDDPAIVLFTSGSTGRPKGIVLSHGYITALAAGVAEWKRMSSSTRTLCYHSPTWMPFIDYLFAPLLKGGCCLYFPDGGSHIIRPTELKAFAHEQGATSAGFVPAMLDILLEEGLPGSMTDVGVGGAAVPADLCRRALASMPQDGVLYTGYSGTEQGDVTAIQMRTDADVEHWATEKGFMGAGRPHAGQRCALLDEGALPVGPDSVGEVAVAGPGLASGYLGLPEKTAETFLPSLPALGGARAARSGDLAVWSGGGNLRVVGRRDSMVKVRGARVELGEVENAVLSHSDVKAACVTVVDDKLVAYVVPAVPGTLRDHCKGRLVAYMVPHVFQGLEELPRLANGKVNKKALPKPEARSDGKEVVMELDSLGQMRKFTRSAASEDRVLDNVRAILIAAVLQGHAIPLRTHSNAMLDVMEQPLAGHAWGPAQAYILRLIRGGGWSSLAFLSGFDDTRAMRPYGLTYREPLFLILWPMLDFNWTMWYLPAFVIMRAVFCAAHHLGLERTHLFLACQVWIVLPAFVDLYIGWQPQSPNIPTECPSQCFCPWAEWPHAQTLSYYLVGWWVDSESPVLHSMLGHALIFIPCYWVGFYSGGGIFKALTRIADEPNVLRRGAVAAGVLALYCVMFQSGQSLLDGYDDRCSSFWGPGGGFLFAQVLRNLIYFLMNLGMSLTYVFFIAAAVPVHLKYLAKICFSSLIVSALTPCFLDLPGMALAIREAVPAAVSPGIEVAWSFVIPFLYELVVGAFFAAVLPLVAKLVIRVYRTFQSKQP